MSDARQSRTAAGALARRLARRFAEGRTALGTDAWSRWVRTCIAGAAAMFALMAALRVAAQWALDSGRLAWERDFLRWLGASGPLGFSDAVFFQTFGSDITLAILIAATAGIAAWLRRPLVSMSIVLAFVVPDLVVRFGWLIWSRARPDFIHGGFASPGFHAFPSGHAAKTMAVYGLLSVLWIRASGSTVERTIAALVLAAIAILVPLGRMAMGVHWPSDVIAGLLLGAAWLAILGYALRQEGGGEGA